LALWFVVKAVEVVTDDFTLAKPTAEVLVAALRAWFNVNGGQFCCRAGIYFRSSR
jgi:hypothetical protein